MGYLGIGHYVTLGILALDVMTCHRAQCQNTQCDIINPTYLRLFFCIYFLLIPQAIANVPVYSLISSTWFDCSQISQFNSHLIFRFLKMVTVHRVKKVLIHKAANNWKLFTTAKLTCRPWIVKFSFVLMVSIFSMWLEFLLISRNPKFLHFKFLALNS